MNNLYDKAKVSKKGGVAEITAEIPWEVLKDFMDQRKESLRENFSAPGFRKGKVPKEIFEEQVSEHHLLEEAAEEALEEIYPDLIENEGLDIVGRPEISITKLAIGSPAEFQAKIAVTPEVKLPNYKKIAEEVMANVKPAEVTEAEIEDVINTLRKMRAPAPADPAKDEVTLPELNDEFVKTLGNFENVSDFREKLKKNMADEKKHEAEHEARETLAARLIEKASMELPEILMADEISTLEAQLSADLAKANISFEDYLKRSGKTKEDLDKDHKDYIERQLKTRFLLQAIAKAEDIKPNEEELNIEARLMSERYPDLDPVRVRAYVQRLLTNEMVMRFLEGKNPSVEPVS